MNDALIFADITCSCFFFQFTKHLIYLIASCLIINIRGSCIITY